MTDKVKRQHKHIDTKNRSTPQLNEPYHYMFPGHKRTSSQINKTKLLKTKHLLQRQHKSLRYDYLDSEILQNDQLHEKRGQQALKNLKLSLSIQRRAKSQFQIIKSLPLQKLQKLHRNFSINDDKIMIVTTSRMELTTQQGNKKRPKIDKQQQQQSQKHTKFHSKNLQERMNEYLNLVVAKSSQDHQQKLRKIRENEQNYTNMLKVTYKQRENKTFARNKFLRQLKARLNAVKKNQLNIQRKEGQDQLKAMTSRLDLNNNNNNLIEKIKNIKQFSSRTAIQDGEQLIDIAIQALSKSMRITHNPKPRITPSSIN